MGEENSREAVAGLSRVSGAGSTIRVAGRTLRVKPLGLQDYGMIESEVLKRKPNPLSVVAAAKDALDPQDYDKLLTKAYKDATRNNKATEGEITQFMESPEGIAYVFWLMLVQDHPDISLEDTDKMISRMDAKDVSELSDGLATASGLDELGNSTGPTADQGETKPLSNGDSGSGPKPQPKQSQPGESITAN